MLILHLIFTLIVNTEENETDKMENYAKGIMIITFTLLLSYAVFSMISLFAFFYRWWKTGKMSESVKENNMGIYPLHLNESTTQNVADEKQFAKVIDDS